MSPLGIALLLLRINSVFILLGKIVGEGEGEGVDAALRIR